MLVSVPTNIASADDFTDLHNGSQAGGACHVKSAI